MKKSTKLLTLLSTSALLGLALTTTVHAAEEPATPTAKTGANSTATVGFNENKEKPSIVNPKNPSKPVDPNTPANPDDPKNPGTGAPGPLSIDYVSNFDFGTKTISNKDETYKLSDKAGKAEQTPFIQVTDNRGKQTGWNLTAKITDFVATDGSSQALKGAKLTIGSRASTATAAYGNKNTAPTIKTPFEFSDTNQAQSIMSATSGTGTGTWLDLIDPDATTIFIPAGNANATAYNATISWNIANGPQN